MHRLSRMTIMTLPFLLGGIAASNAQEGRDPEAAVPVELFACEWREGKGMDDLLEVAEGFKQWADEHDSGYSAWVITPQFLASENPLQVGWIGAWTSGDDMGKGMDAWRSEGREAAAAFDKVVDCSSAHALMASYQVHAPEGPPEDGIVWFSSCTLAEGSKLERAIEAHGKTAAMMQEMGGKASSWVFVPALGAGDIDFDYYSVVSHDSYADLGSNFERYFNQGAGMKASANLQGVASCDSPRLYDAHQIRAGSQ
jgi:hypothetical protein